MPETTTPDAPAAAETTDATPDLSVTTPPAAPAGDTPAVTPSEPTEQPDLGDAGKAALQKEREARKNAEKAAREAQKRLDAIEADKLSETEKLKKQAEDGQAAAATATAKLRQANLLSALADQGLTGGKAKAAARLLDGVEFDDDDEPTNLTDAMKAARASFGEELFTAATADPKKPELPDLHAGARVEKPATPDSTGWFPKLKT